jgi:catechol 2,3-dioxygenase-like lactoylglutathione lyase family enzyme/Arc/MetJ family transcription regulator
VTTTDPWGRVDDDGTVYVRTSEGERVVGSWQAGAPEEALAFFRRKFEDLVTKVELLEQRLRNTDLAAGQALESVSRLREEVGHASAVGDLDSLLQRLDRLSEAAEQRKLEQRQAAEEARSEARDVKERIVAEAERVAAETTHWKSGGERMRQLIEEWKAAPRADRATEQALWRRMSAARNSFSKRRKAYFANLDSQREQVRLVKDKLVEEAFKVSGAKTKRELVHIALQALIRAGRKKDLLDLAGKIEFYFEPTDLVRLQLLAHVPLGVRDLERSIAFYRETLGFEVEWNAGAICSVGRDGCSIMLQLQERAPGGTVWIGLADGSIFAGIAETDAKVLQPPTRQPWAHEMKILDPDGNTIWLGADPKA